MGIIKAGLSAMSGAAGDQWKEAFACGQMDAETLIRRADRLTGKNSGNQGSKNVITEGSLIIVGEGECAIVTENGKIIGVYDQPGEQIFGSEKSSGFFTGGMRAFSKDVKRRIAFGGDAPYFQRVFYINTKELAGSSFSVDTVPFRFRDERAGIDLDGSIGCSVTYSFHIVAPECFYKKYARASVDKSRGHLVKQMNSELKTALGPALNSLLQNGVRPSELPEQIDALQDKLTQAVNREWRAGRGIEIRSLAIASLRVTDGKLVQTAQRDAAFLEPTRAAAHLVGSMGDALNTAAENPAGTASMAVMGGQRVSRGWKCSCGCTNDGNFCFNCGTTRPVRWLCGCGNENSGKFCENCGQKKPDQA